MSFFSSYVLTGDNLTKMMFALYRIRCGLPVIIFGEAGVGKSALFRFLIHTLLGHTFDVCNVNSGTSIEDVEKKIESAMEIVTLNPSAQVFLFFDEMNTADSHVIAFFRKSLQIFARSGQGSCSWAGISFCPIEPQLDSGWT